MKRLYLLFILFIVISASFAQSKTDSTKYYSKILTQKYRQSRDSLFNDPEFKRISERLREMAARSDDYFSFTIFGNYSAVDFSTINKENALAGFPAMEPNAYSVGVGFSRKKNRIIYDFNFASLGINRRVKKGDEKIAANFSNALQLDIGYDLVKNNRVNIYPYAGLGFRLTSLSYKSNKTTNGSYTNITEIISNNSSFNESTTEFGYQAGLGLEYALLNKRSNTSGTIIFVKGGTNRAFREKKFDVAGIKYDPQFNYGNWNFSVGFKFFGR